jgi:ABC-2 type transport system ATP-binding protein
MAANHIIETRGLTKIYGGGAKQTLALDSLNLQVQPGEIFGFLGPNGAGKTTTIRLLLDLIRPTKGDATIFGKDVRESSVELHEDIGFLPGELALWKNRTGKQVINYIASVRGNVQAQTSYAAQLADRLKFDQTRRVGEYSSGNKRKLGLILALMHQPKLLILDEPTGGLDPLMQQIFNQMMREAKQEGRTVFLSSHVLSEVQAICDRVGILREGDLKAVEDVATLTHVDFRRVALTLRDAVPQEVVARLHKIEGIADVTAAENKLNLKLIGDFDPVLRALSDTYVVDLHTEDPTLEDIFLAFYGNGENEDANKKVEAMA